MLGAGRVRDSARRDAVTQALALACLAAVLPPGARSFQLAAPPAATYRSGTVLSGRCPGVGRVRPATVAGRALALPLRASANAGPDAGLPKEQKLKKYRQLQMELITKAQKLPPGSASKTRYLMQARNAKAMADALGYSAEPVNPKQASFDAAVAYKAAKGDVEEAAAPPRPKKEKISFEIVSAQPEMADQLTDVVNWAYRGKSGEQGWTGEMEFIDGIRIALEDMRKTLADSVVLVAVHGDRIAGCVKIEQLDSGEAEVGMFAVDPDFQSCGVGRALLDAAHDFAGEVMDAKETVMMVLDNRQDIIAWYQTCGYEPTSETAPFPKGLNVGVPKRELQFVRLKRQVPAA